METLTPTPTTTRNLPRVAKAIQSAVIWIRTHQEQFWAIAGTVLGAAVLIYFMIHRRQVENDEAWTQLGVAQGYWMQGQATQATKALDEWSGRFSGSGAAPYAKFLRADLLYNTSDYVKAAGLYSELVQTAKPAELRPLALAGQSASEEMAGHIPQASAAAQQFLDRYPDHFLAASMYINQARLAELAGNTTGATAIYDRFVILYPQSPWTAFARARLQTLGAPASSAPAPK